MINRWKDVNSHIAIIMKNSIMRNIAPPTEIPAITSGSNSAEEGGREKGREEGRERDRRRKEGRKG